MKDPPSSTVGADAITVVGSDEQTAVAVDVERWSRLAHAVLAGNGRRGELTLTFVDRDEMTALNAEHMHHDGPTDVLSFPLDADLGPEDLPVPDVPVLLGDVVICPAVAAEQAPAHAGTLDDELALLVVHGVLHVLGQDHAEPGERSRMRAREVELLERHHWLASAPPAFRQDHQ